MWKSQRNEKMLQLFKFQDTQLAKHLKFNLTGVKKFCFLNWILFIILCLLNTKKYILCFFQSRCLSQQIYWIRWSRFCLKRWPDRLWKTFGRIARLGRNTWKSKYLKFFLGLSLFYQHKLKKKNQFIFKPPRWSRGNVLASSAGGHGFNPTAGSNQRLENCYLLLLH